MANLQQMDVTLASAGTAQQLSTNSERVVSVIIRPRSTNVGTIFVGTSAVVAATETGVLATATAPYVINPSAAAGELEEINLTSIWFDGTNTSDVIHVQYLVADQ
jgi:hypothetical protein